MEEISSQLRNIMEAWPKEGGGGEEEEEEKRKMEKSIIFGESDFPQVTKKFLAFSRLALRWAKKVEGRGGGGGGGDFSSLLHLTTASYLFSSFRWRALGCSSYHFLRAGETGIGA